MDIIEIEFKEYQSVAQKLHDGASQGKNLVNGSATAEIQNALNSAVTDLDKLRTDLNKWLDDFTSNVE